jgi:hypothetical protein
MDSLERRQGADRTQAVVSGNGGGRRRTAKRRNETIRKKDRLRNEQTENQKAKKKNGRQGRGRRLGSVLLPVTEGTIAVGFLVRVVMKTFRRQDGREGGEAEKGQGERKFSKSDHAAQPFSLRVKDENIIEKRFGVCQRLKKR